MSSKAGDELIAVFREEAERGVARLRDTLGVRTAGEAPGWDTRELLRLTHNLAGAARAVGLGRLAEAFERLHAAVASVGEEGDTPSEVLVERIVRGVEECERLFAETAGREGESGADGRDRSADPAPDGPQRFGDAGEEPDPRLLEAFRSEAAAHLEVLRPILDGVLDDPGAPVDLEDLRRRVHGLKGAARACGFRALERRLHGIEETLRGPPSGREEAAAAIWRPLAETLDALEDTLHSGRESMPSEPAVAGASAREGPPPREPAKCFPREDSDAGAPQAQQTAGRLAAGPRGSTARLRVDPLAVDRVLRAASDLVQFESLEETSFADAIREAREALEAAARDLARGGAGNPSPGAPQHAGRAVVRLTRTLSRLEYRLVGSARERRRRAAEVAAAATRLRFVAAADVFGGLRRTVRDAAREQGKEARFVLAGGDVVADRSVLEGLFDAVLHLVRNAVAHGIEPPEERSKTAKPKEGIVRLVVGLAGRYLELVLSDDGRGIDREAVEAEGGGEAWRELIFRQGFSMSDGVDTLRGRGVGLAAVRESVEALGGEVAVETESGRGTTFRLRVPVRLTATRLLYFRSGDGIYAFPTARVERVLPPGEGRVCVGGRLLVLGGASAPRIALSRVVGERPGPDRGVHVLARTPAGSTAVAVDEVLAERGEVVHGVRAVGGCPSWLQGIACFDGRRDAVVIDPRALEIGPEAMGAPSRQEASVEERKAGRRTVLVVDDSFTTRTLETIVLEDRGYRVLTARDGLEALERLREEDVDLVVTDIEMPRLDGFGLVERLRADDRTAAVPVVVVTSLEREEDRRRALEAGADAYVVKARFDQDDWMATLEGLL